MEHLPSTMFAGLDNDYAMSVAWEHHMNNTQRVKLDDTGQDGSPSDVSPEDVSGNIFWTPANPSDGILDDNTARLPASEMPMANDKHVAFGTLRLYWKHFDDEKPPEPYVRGLVNDDIYPSTLINSGIRKKWIRTDAQSVGTIDGITHTRVYILPEDVDLINRPPVTDEYRKVIKYLLHFVDRTIACWLGREDPRGPVNVWKLPVTENEESLFYMFNTLPSPNPQLATFKGDPYGFEAMSDVLGDEIGGLKAQLYPYQKRSVATMIQRESAPAKLGDPRKTKLLDMYGRPFYLDFNDGALSKDLHYYTEPQGGILAETMGYGKTLICLALILATRGHYPQIPQHQIECVERKPGDKVRSLMSMAAYQIKYEGLPWKQHFHALAEHGYKLENCTSELARHDRTYTELPRSTSTVGRRSQQDSPGTTLMLCSATLIIVPPNLLVQWQHEISSHVDDDALDLLVVDSASDEIPRGPWLAKYDVILMSKSRFEQEGKDHDGFTDNWSRTLNQRYVSPLAEMKWLRVICDEGHGFAGSSSKTNAMALFDKMHIERRWVVSGTPSSTLHGVEVGLSTSHDDPESPKSTRQASLETALTNRRIPDAHELEAKDLEKLRLIVVNFLKLQPWANNAGSSDRANWKHYLAPVTDASGKRHSKNALRTVLDTLIIRHRIEDIDLDLALPPLHHKIISLQPSYYDKLTVNLFTMILAANYVTSEREDEDYMFHPKNRKKFDLLINNLIQATFHWVGISEELVQETIHNSREYQLKHPDKVSVSDRLLLIKAIATGERALADPGWRAFANLHEIGAYVSNLPGEVGETWSLDGCDTEISLLGTVQARSLQKLLQPAFRKNDGSDPYEGLVGAGLRAMRDARNKAQQDKRASSSKSKSDDTTVIGDEPKLRGRSASIHSPSKLVKSPASSKRRKQQELSRALSVPYLASPPTTPGQPQRDLPPLPQVLGFTSSKLTYLTSQLLQHTPSEKCLIFYTHNNTAFFIAEALELLSIPFLIYANTLSVTTRAQYLASFNADTSPFPGSPPARVLLMDLKQAGQGLHVASASRVYIISPIWDGRTESQAIKRAHRIGQTRPVFVETLVLEGTVEEDLVRRRSHSGHIKQRRASEDTNTMEVDPDGDLTMADDETSPITSPEGRGLLDDSVMVRALKDLSFLPFNDDRPFQTDDETTPTRLPTTQPLITLLDKPSSPFSSSPPSDALISPTTPKRKMFEMQLDGSDMHVNGDGEKTRKKRSRRSRGRVARESITRTERDVKTWGWETSSRSPPVVFDEAGRLVPLPDPA